MFDLMVRAHNPSSELLRELGDMPELAPVPCLSGLKPGNLMIKTDRVLYDSSSGKCSFSGSYRVFAQIKENQGNEGTVFCAIIDQFIHSNELLRQTVLGPRVASFEVSSPEAYKTDPSDVHEPEVEYVSRLENENECTKGMSFRVCPERVVFFNNKEYCGNEIVVPIPNRDVRILASELGTHAMGLNVPCTRSDERVYTLKEWGKYIPNAVWGELIGDLVWTETRSGYVLSGQYKCHGIENTVYEYKDQYFDDRPAEVSISNRRAAEDSMDMHCAWVSVLRDWIRMIQRRAGLDRV
jgi:hypothetical protein